MLIVFSGLPGTGKTTLAKALAGALDAVYLRIDSIEQALRNSAALHGDVGSSGYVVANAIALDNLRAARTVVADCVNPVRESREAWADTARHCGCPLLNIEVRCSDKRQHQQRVESRVIDVPGLAAPSWRSVLAHEYEAWGEPPFTIDTALTSPDAAQRLLLEHVSAHAAALREHAYS